METQRPNIQPQTRLFCMFLCDVTLFPERESRSGHVVNLMEKFAFLSMATDLHPALCRGWCCIVTSLQINV